MPSIVWTRSLTLGAAEVIEDEEMNLLLVLLPRCHGR